MLDRTYYLRPSPWTEGMEDRLKLFWSAGLTASQISAEFQGVFTRSAIIGKVHRLKLESRASPILTATEIEERRKRRNQAKYDWRRKTGYRAP